MLKQLTFGDFLPDMFITQETVIGNELFEQIEGFSIFEIYMVMAELSFPEYFGEMDWVTISSFKCLSIGFIERYSYLLDWKTLCSYQRFNIEFIKKYSKFMDKKSLMFSHSKILNETTFEWSSPLIKQKRTYFENDVFECIIKIIQFDNPEEYLTLDWARISGYRYLSENFIDTHINMMNIKSICTVQRLTMNIVKKYASILDYACMSITQVNNIELEFIIENKDKFNMTKVKKNINTFKNYVSSNSYHQERRRYLGIFDDGIIVNKPTRILI